MDCHVCPKKNMAEGATLRRRDPFCLSGQVSRLQLLGAAAIWLLASTYSLADTVVLTGGDIIEGVITKQSRSTVVLESYRKLLAAMELLAEPPEVQINAISYTAGLEAND